MVSQFGCCGSRGSGYVQIGLFNGQGTQVRLSGTRSDTWFSNNTFMERFSGIAVNMIELTFGSWMWNCFDDIFMMWSCVELYGRNQGSIRLSLLQ